jgi:hypothetical protein
MKKWIILFSLLLATSFQMLSAQSGLSIDAFFRMKKVGVGFDIKGDFKLSNSDVETLIQGEKIEPYHLNLFRSLRMILSESRYGRLCNLLEEDAESAVNKEVESVDGRITYALLSFPPRQGVNRYVCFQCTAQSGSLYEATLVYMEGEATLKQLKEFFK